MTQLVNLFQQFRSICENRKLHIIIILSMYTYIDISNILTNRTFD